VKRGAFLAAGVGLGFWLGFGLSELINRKLWNDQRPEPYKPAWERTTR
jgi:hypothetical protein